jgi:hydroxymethylpyrimidine/phosphomethylpyrimidine kinase
MISALTIGGSDPSAGAGIQADLRALSYLGVYGCSVITCLTAQNSQKLEEIYPIPGENIESQLEVLMDDVKINACKTGMLYSPNTIELVAEKLSKAEFPLVVDPVLAASVGGELHEEGFVESLIKDMLPKTTLFTPNIPEAEAILENMGEKTKINDIEVMKKSCEIIHDIGCRYVLLKGGHLEGKTVKDVLYNGDEYRFYLSQKADKNIHGTGCVFSALITGLIAKGHEIETAIENAELLISDAISHSRKIGKGLDVLELLHSSRIYEETDPMAMEIELACQELLYILPIEWVPEVGINIGYAKVGTTSISEVYALEGRILRAGNKVVCQEKAKPGASRHIARIILTCMTYDKKMLSAMNIKYDPDIIELCKRAELKIGSFNRNQEPESVSTMEWGTETVIKKLGFVPDIIYDTGGIGKEAMIRILGTEPKDVLNKLKSVIEAPKSALPT